MDFKRYWHTLRLYMIRNASARAEYIRKQHIYGTIGENCIIQKAKVPLYAKLIRIGNNVQIASNVSFLTHDVTHYTLNNMPERKEKAQERIGCIEIGDNVFVGSGTHILYDTKIGSNVIIGTCSVVTKDIPDNSVVSGVPARVMGTFDDYVAKRLGMEKYPDEIKPKIGGDVSDALAEYLWERFDRTHP